MHLFQKSWSFFSKMAFKGSTEGVYDVIISKYLIIDKICVEHYQKYLLAVYLVKFGMVSSTLVSTTII